MLARDFLIEMLREDSATRAAWDAGLRPRIGVSACLVGERVRYDGDHRRVALIADLLPGVATLVPLCPEVAIGLGVPRPTIQRVRLADGREIVRGIDDRTLDVTQQLDDYAAQVAREQAPFNGYIFKARSPSCAPANAPLFDENDVPVGTAWGRYAEGVRRSFPRIPVCHEEQLATVGVLAGFVVACYRTLSR